ncbi:MAG TPA: hypothetical protein VLK85_07345 [Ramlibacter sp.]|nr:hypothetical protein [Ramlibacter sp.]
MKQDKQPRRPSKPMGKDKLHPPSDMDSQAKGGDKESNEMLKKQQPGSGPQSTPARKPNRP